ncbi:MAG: hypothetical protein ACXU85_00445 [Xanthobacteraceae bacterium]|jgi:hypothetical protein
MNVDEDARHEGHCPLSGHILRSDPPRPHVPDRGGDDGRLRFHLFRPAIAGSIVATAMMRDYTGKDIDGECH